MRPGVLATATYGTGGRIAELVIAREIKGDVKSRIWSVFSKEELTAIIDELVPKGERGNFLMGEFDNIFCLPDDDCAGVSEDYEKLSIYYNAAQEGKVHYAVVQWK